MTAKDEYTEKLAKVAHLTPDEAKKALLEEIQSELTGEIAKKIRAAEMQKIPRLLIIGDKEITANAVSVRERGKGGL